MIKAPGKISTTTDIEGIDMASLTGPYCVEALNNDVSTFDDVMDVFVHACGYDAGKAKHYTLKIHTEGRAICFWGGRERCEAVILAFKGILVKCNLMES
jgi:ATP-dependent Clp protease adapter protein ClpS